MGDDKEKQDGEYSTGRWMAKGTMDGTKQGEGTGVEGWDGVECSVEDGQWSSGEEGELEQRRVSRSGKL